MMELPLLDDGAIAVRVRPGLPLVIESRAPGASLEAAERWIGANRCALKSCLTDFGAIVFRGFDCVDSIGNFESVVDSVCPVLMPYLGGTTSREPLSSRIGSASGARFTGIIPAHQEMSYQDLYPTHLMFWCQQPARRGGETLLASARALRDALPGEVWDTFKRRGVSTRRRLAPKDAPWSVWKGRPWNRALLTDDPGEAERILTERGWHYSWTRDGGIAIEQPPLPGTRIHPETGEEIWFNQVHLNHPYMVQTVLRASRRRLARLGTAAWQAIGGGWTYPNQTRFGDGARIPAYYPRTVQRCLDAVTIAFPWQRNDFMILDNHLVLHGRAPFEGPRMIGAALLTSAFDPPPQSDRSP